MEKTYKISQFIILKKLYIDRDGDLIFEELLYVTYNKKT